MKMQRWLIAVTAVNSVALVSILIHYPETVLFRLADPKSGPVVKIDASEHGSGARFSDDSEHGGAVLSAKKGEGAVLQLTDPSGRQQTVRP